MLLLLSVPNKDTWKQLTYTKYIANRCSLNILNVKFRMLEHLTLPFSEGWTAKRHQILQRSDKKRYSDNHLPYLLYVLVYFISPTDFKFSSLLLTLTCNRNIHCISLHLAYNTPKCCIQKQS